MNTDLQPLEEVIHTHLCALVETIGPRPLGSPANREAQAYIAQAMRSAGLEVREQGFDCLEWIFRQVRLALDGELLPVKANFYSPPCDATLPFVALGSYAELEAASLGGKIALLYGSLTREPYMPKNFKFWSSEEQQAVIRLLEDKQPVALIAVSPQDENFPPVFDDGDFHLPSVTVPAAVGRRLLANPHGVASLQVESQISPAGGANVIGIRGAGEAGRRVVCAHFDTKTGTPGALDNAAGVAAMLALAALLKDVSLPDGVEFVAFNGEDDYSQAGQMAYLESMSAGPTLAVNIDGAGLPGKRSTVALFECDAQLAQTVRRLVAAQPHIVEAEPWPMGDHMLFAMQGIPSLAFTSEGIETQLEAVIHTEKDTVDRVSAVDIAHVVRWIRDLLT